VPDFQGPGTAGPDDPVSLVRPVNLVREATSLAAAQHLLSEMYGTLRIKPRGPRRGVRATRPYSVTVRAVAYRWGFSSPSRFAAYYRRAYGVCPSRILHSAHRQGPQLGSAAYKQRFGMLPSRGLRS
jgi:AraC-like DNA-binding protein